jgi:hypothetical protein
VLFDRRLGGRGLQDFYIGGDVDRLDVDELDDAVLFEPAEEVTHNPVICHAGILVADRRCKELQEPARGMIAGRRDRCRNRERTLYRRRPHWRRHVDDGRRTRAISAHGVTQSIDLNLHMPTCPPDRALV